MHEHANARGAQLTKRAVLAGCRLELVWTETAESRHRERLIKRSQPLKNRCFRCRNSLPPDPNAMILPAPAWSHSDQVETQFVSPLEWSKS